MTKLKVVDKGIVLPVEYDEKYAKGIFLVNENKLVKRNCNILSIDVSDNTNPLELFQRMTKLDKTVILTTRVDSEYFQYILQHYAEKADFNLLLQERTPPQSRELLTEAFNFTKMNTLGDIDLLGGALGNKN